MKRIALTIIALLSITLLGAEELEYGIPQSPWEESFGSHRAVLDVPQDADAAQIVYGWRRHDHNVDAHRFIVVNAESGDTVANVLRKQVDDEVCNIVFGPVKKGTYHFYYLPYVVQMECGWCDAHYLPQEEAPDQEWAAKATEPVAASIVKVEARTGMDSFYPMELAATKAEVQAFIETHPGDVHLFPEDREHPVIMKDKIPSRWLSTPSELKFKGIAAPNEYYALQVAVWASGRESRTLAYSISDLKKGRRVIPSSAVTCFNLEGVNPFGEARTYEVNVEQGKVQPLWFGIDVPRKISRGKYKGVLTISDSEGVLGEIPVMLRVKGKPLEDRGDGQTWRHSRLRWLNSTLGIEDTPTLPYTPVTRSGNTVSVLGRQFEFDAATGSPRQVTSLGNDILSRPVRFVVKHDGKQTELNGTFEPLETTDGHFCGTCKSEDEDMAIECSVRLEFDGWMDTHYTITTKKDIKIDDIRLEIAVDSEVGKYFMGLGLPGQDTPDKYLGCWDKPVSLTDAKGAKAALPQGDDWTWPFDSYWVGRHDAGLHLEFRGTTYSAPLLNVYRPAYPDSWYNGGKGGFEIQRKGNEVVVSAYSGSRMLQKDTTLTFEYAMIATPVKAHDQNARFVERYYHACAPDLVKPSDEDIERGVKVVNLHHATAPNPFINYPFLVADSLRNFVSDMHSKGVKVKFYYTVREMSTIATEFWAAWSLGHEIIRGGSGGGYSWLNEHMVEDYYPQWYNEFPFDRTAGRNLDCAVLMTEGETRWCNYYVEGLAWMIKNTDADGIYMDDVAFDRRIMKRMRRAMESVKPGCLIDLHSNTWYSKGPACQYAEFFPYIDKIWFGESFRYNEMSPANFLVECSGIPYGLPGEMLQDGGNRWLGMQYGLTARCNWVTGDVSCDPRPVWKIWDEFKIQDAQMIGYWDPKPVATSSDEKVKVTAFVKDGKALLSIGNYSDETRSVSIDLDWAALGLSAESCILSAPEIEAFQDAATWKPGERISVEPRRGWLIYVEQK